MADRSVLFEGGCLCGAVRYRASHAPSVAGHCYCTDCRKSSGTGHCSHMAVAKEAVDIQGEVTFYNRPADSGNLISRGFCATCGAAVYSLNSGFADLVFIRASSLDDPTIFEPQMVVYAHRAPDWDTPDTQLPVMEDARAASTLRSP